MTRTPARPPALRGTMFRGSEQVRAGVLTPAQLRSSAWQRLFPDVYACASLPITHHRRARAVARLLLPGAVLSGRSAAVLWGADAAARDDPVECTLAPDRRCGAVRGVLVSRRHLPDDAVVQRHGVLVTTPLRTALDLARTEPADEAVVRVDQFLQTGLVTLAELRAAAAGATGPGCRLVRRAVDRADGLAQSPQETRLRLLLQRTAFLQGPTASLRVVGGSEVLPFGWPAQRVPLEYDGVWHGEAQQVGKDRRRLNRLTAAGWTVVFVTAADLRDPAALVGRIWAALRTQRYV
ncbi:hypothetical protein E9529_06170 [Blastococcus sp. KM273128]|uniref:hypothetical protein n=1 Tax=Blastococcus sp. KM273128 TaxID=2570314 RepID=UPI001F21D1F7|nr:hypothetical protein [Blastococcus sp. KM273128]MCF6743865.1 hypothetical protein [Blastococcus sp. KM273128]